MNARVVFDTSTLVGAIFRAGSVPDQALQQALGSFELCICAKVLAELRAVLSKPRFDRCITIEAREAFLELLRRNGTSFLIGESELSGVDPPCRDSSDNFVLALALAAKADFLVSSDHDLLVLNPWRGIPILTPSEFVAQFST